MGKNIPAENFSSSKMQQAGRVCWTDQIITHSFFSLNVANSVDYCRQEEENGAPKRKKPSNIR